MNKQRIILHLDMNSYFASVEQQANPHLRGKPVGVCEHLGGIIIAPSVEAKRLGIKLGTPVWEALKIDPKIVLLPTDPEKYMSVTERFMKILEDYVGKSDEVDPAGEPSGGVERYSIDEAFIPHPCNKGEGCDNSCYNDALMLGLEIKQRIKQEVGEWVSCSVGIGPNKLVSKIAADLGGGDIDRIYVVRPEKIKKLYQMLELTDVPGIGSRYERRLNQLGIYSLQELAEYPAANLINQFGVAGYFLHQMANFNMTDFSRHSGNATLTSRHSGAEQSGAIESFRFYRRPLASSRMTDAMTGEELPKSIGHSYTLPRATSDLNEIKQLMFKLSEKVGRRLRKHKARARVVHYFHGSPLHLPLGKGEKGRGWFSRQKRLGEHIFDSRDIYRSAYSIFKSQLSPAGEPSSGAGPSGEPSSGVKIMGVSVSSFTFEMLQEPLFEQYKKPLWLVQAMDQINDKYGEFALRRAQFLGAPTKWAKETVGFGRTKKPRA